MNDARRGTTILSNPLPAELAMPSVNSNLPPMPPRPAPGTQTSDRYGNVISTRPEPKPYTPPSAPAPTSDRYGNIVSAPEGWSPNPNHVPIPGTNYVPNSDGVVVWK